MTPLYPIALSAIRAARSCEGGWTKLLKSLGCPPRSEWSAITVTLGDVAASNGAADARWCARCLPDDARRDVIRAILPSVKRASAHTTDARVHDCIAVIEAWVAGSATINDLTLAARAARAAARTGEAEARAAERKRQVADIIAVFGRCHA